MRTVKDILKDGDREELLYLFTFDEVTPELLAFKFNVFARYAFTRFFKVKDAPFHKDIDIYNAKAYLGLIDSFTDIAFRDAAKTTRTKLFTAFAIACDIKHRKGYLKVLSEDESNSKQFVTDIYNLLIDPTVQWLFPDIFAKTDAKREETMSSFTTATGVKLKADTVGSSQRGQIQEEKRPDWIIFDDFETKKTLRSAVVTNSIWDNMEEARTGLAKNGACIYLSQYLSERGNVHKIVEKQSDRDIVLITPIIDDEGNPMWPAKYTRQEAREILDKAEDPEGEYLCKPAAGKDIIFDRYSLDAMQRIQSLKEVAGLKIFKKFDPSHRYAGGHDVAGGVGLDSATSVYMDFDTFPVQVVATFKDNEIKPDVFGDEIAREAGYFGEPLEAVERNNHGHATLGRLKQIYPLDKIFSMGKAETRADVRQTISTIEYGYLTNAATKPKMIFAFAKAVNDGLVSLNDPDLIKECHSYTRGDLMDKEPDPRLATRHFDLLMAACICWQMKDELPAKKQRQEYRQQDFDYGEYENPTPGNREVFHGSNQNVFDPTRFNKVINVEDLSKTTNYDELSEYERPN